jgi:hypothetical protein
MSTNGSTLGTGLVESAALTTLVGSVTAESLVTLPENIKLLGKRTVTAVTGNSVTNRLVSGDLGISLTVVNDVKDVVQSAVTAGQGLCRMLDPRIKLT